MVFCLKKESPECSYRLEESRGNLLFSSVLVATVRGSVSLFFHFFSRLKDGEKSQTFLPDTGRLIPRSGFVTGSVGYWHS